MSGAAASAISAPTQSAADRPLLVVSGLVKHFSASNGPRGAGHSGPVRAVDGIGFSLAAGEALGLIGESGCGKSTTARMLLGLVEPTAGSISLGGEELMGMSAGRLKAYRRRVQMLFQDPYSSLNPRRSVAAIVAEPLVVHSILPDRSARTKRVAELIESVGLGAEHAGRYPHELSGGQRQRVGLARALALDPELLIADEPVSALDRSAQAQILSLLIAARRSRDLALLLIAHDLALARHACDRIAVMYSGKIVEIAAGAELVEAPLHPYTQALIAAAAPRRSWVLQQPGVQSSQPAAGTIKSQSEQLGSGPVSGCRYRLRCAHASGICAEIEPSLTEVSPERLLACHHPLGSQPPARGVGSTS